MQFWNEGIIILARASSIIAIASGEDSEHEIITWDVTQLYGMAQKSLSREERLACLRQDLLIYYVMMWKSVAI